MEYAKVERGGKNTFNVIDKRDGKTVKRNVRGCKAVAYAEYYNEQVKEANKLWEILDK